jgi:hypothetical protein
MTMYDSSNGINCTMRISGMEPKIKYDAEIAGKSGHLSRAGSTSQMQVVYAFVKDIVRKVLQPEESVLAPLCCVWEEVRAYRFEILRSHFDRTLPDSQSQVTVSLRNAVPIQPR